MKNVELCCANEKKYRSAKYFLIKMKTARMHLGRQRKPEFSMWLLKKLQELLVLGVCLKKL